MNDTDLRKLSAAVEYLLSQDSFSSVVERLRRELAETNENFVWANVDLNALPCEIPSGIRSSWIFHLRKDVPSGSHYHPNSVQHMVLVGGQGMSSVDEVRRPMVQFKSTEHSFADKWLIIDQGVPHEFIPERENMTVVSFHTCDASELEEIDCSRGRVRIYKDADA